MFSLFFVEALIYGSLILVGLAIIFLVAAVCLDIKGGKLW